MHLSQVGEVYWPLLADLLWSLKKCFPQKVPQSYGLQMFYVDFFTLFEYSNICQLFGGAVIYICYQLFCSTLHSLLADISTSCLTVGLKEYPVFDKYVLFNNL